MPLGIFLANEHLRTSLQLTRRTPQTLGAGRFYRPNVTMEGNGRGPRKGNELGEGSSTSCLFFVGEKPVAGTGSEAGG